MLVVTNCNKNIKEKQAETNATDEWKQMKYMNIIMM